MDATMSAIDVEGVVVLVFWGKQAQPTTDYTKVGVSTDWTKKTT